LSPAIWQAARKLAGDKIAHPTTAHMFFITSVF
jgi:hypothetical protein